jgi:hypothetical protein
VLFWIAWRYRHKKAGAFFWGLLGICLGQIHMSGFFLAGGVFLWTAFRGRLGRWGYWLMGSLAGSIPLIPWLRYMAAQPGTGFHWKSLLWILYPKYWAYWVTDSLGVGHTYSLKTKQFLDFLRYPLVDGRGTYLVGVLHLVLITAGILILVSAKKARAFSRGLRDSSETGLAVNSLLLAMGILLSLARVEIFRHYLIATFPLEWVWLSRLSLVHLKLGRRYLMVIWTAQLLVTTAFLFYIHLHHGDAAGDYGIAYQFQPP